MALICMFMVFSWRGGEGRVGEGRGEGRGRGGEGRGGEGRGGEWRGGEGKGETAIEGWHVTRATWLLRLAFMTCSVLFKLLTPTLHLNLPVSVFLRGTNFRG